MLKLTITLAACFCCAFALRQTVIEVWAHQTQEIFLKDRGLPANSAIEVHLLNFRRGDFVIELYSPPLAPRRFTVNRFDRSIVDWR
jgi:hypothetical protein